MDSKQAGTALEEVSEASTPPLLDQTAVLALGGPSRRKPRLVTPSRFDIPFYSPYVVGTESALMARAIQSSKLSGDGPLTERCHALLESSLSTPRALLTTSCTHALEMAALLLAIGPGDEVILPSYTFVSTANAFVLRGATPVFVDIRSDTQNLDERLLEAHITERTRAIVVVHYAGVACEMESILAIAARRGIPVVEDNAHGLYGKYADRYLGTLGVLGTQSFHETKNFTCGEGGALLVNDEALVTRAEIIREKGTDRSNFRRGEIDKYTWRDLGSSYLPSDILAAFLLAQLEAREVIQGRRKRIFQYYDEHLASWARSQGVSLPTVPRPCEPAYHMYYLVMPCAEDRARLTAHLRERGIQASPHYLPLHTSEMGQRFGYTAGDLPVTEHVSECLLRLPLFCDLTQEQLERVAEAVLGFVPGT